MADKSDKKEGTSLVLLGVYMTLWYAFNVVYNVFNKKVLNVFPMPWTVASLQLGIGLAYVLPVWVLGLFGRKMPNFGLVTQSISPVAALHAAGHCLTVISLGAGSVSFTHIIKAAEPFFSTILGAILFQSYQPTLVNITLVPVMGGVAIASMKELSFTWTSFSTAMGSNTCFALRSLYSKKVKASLDENEETKMGSADLFGVITVISFLMTLPFAIILEGPDLMEAYNKAIEGEDGQKQFLTNFLYCGMSYYMYNELSYLTLGALSPVAHAVANTIKRVVILIASVFFLGAVMTEQSIFGSGVAIAGVLLFSLAKSATAPKPKAS